MYDELLLTILATSVGKEKFINGYIVEEGVYFEGQIYGYNGLSKRGRWDSLDDAIRWLAAETTSFLGDGMMKVFLGSKERIEVVMGRLTSFEIASRATKVVKCDESEWLDFNYDTVIVTANKLDKAGDVFLELKFTVWRYEEHLVCRCEEYLFSINSGTSAFEMRHKTAKEAAETMEAFGRIMKETDGGTRFDLTLTCKDESKTIKGFKLDKERLTELITRLEQAA